MTLSATDVEKAKKLIKHLNKAQFHGISVAEAIEVSDLLRWFGKSIQDAENPKPVEPKSKITKRGK